MNGKWVKDQGYIHRVAEIANVLTAYEQREIVADQ
jgi:hypothetical protein